MSNRWASLALGRSGLVARRLDVAWRPSGSGLWKTALKTSRWGNYHWAVGFDPTFAPVLVLLPTKQVVGIEN
jgi:hypothetical protein